MHQILLWVGLLEIFSSVATIQVSPAPFLHTWESFFKVEKNHQPRS